MTKGGTDMTILRITGIVRRTALLLLLTLLTIGDARSEVCESITTIDERVSIYRTVNGLESLRYNKIVPPSTKLCIESTAWRGYKPVYWYKATYGGKTGWMSEFSLSSHPHK